MPPSLNFSQFDFVKPLSGFHPVTWERVSLAKQSLMVLLPPSYMSIGKHGIVALKMGKIGYHVLKFHQDMDSVIKVNKFQPLSFCKMRYWYLGCVETFYWSFSTSLFVILLFIQPFHVFPLFFLWSDHFHFLQLLISFNLTYIFVL